MTPEQARALLDGTTPAPWEHSDSYGITEISAPGKAIATDANPKDAPLIAAAPDMAAMIANMTVEYSVERNCSVIEGEPDWEKIGFGMYPGIIANTFWTTEKKLAERLYEEAKTGHLPVRIVMRYVTAPQPLGGAK